MMIMHTKILRLPTLSEKDYRVKGAIPHLRMKLESGRIGESDTKVCVILNPDIRSLYLTEFNILSRR